MYSSKSKICYNVKSWAYYFHVKTKADFQICISVPSSNTNLLHSKLINFKLSNVSRKLFRRQLMRIFKTPNVCLQTYRNNRTCPKIGYLKKQNLGTICY